MRPRSRRSETPLVLFTVLAQAAAGAVLTREIVRLFAPGLDGLTGPVRIVALATLLAGFVAAGFHLGRPRAARFVFANLGSSWLGREVLLGGAFAGAVALPFAAARLPAAVLGIAFVYAMSRVYRLRTVPEWDRPATPLAFFGTALVLGGTTVVAVAWYAPLALAVTTLAVLTLFIHPPGPFRTFATCLGGALLLAGFPLPAAALLLASELTARRRFYLSPEAV